MVETREETGAETSAETKVATGVETGAETGAETETGSPYDRKGPSASAPSNLSRNNSNTVHVVMHQVRKIICSTNSAICLCQVCVVDLYTFIRLNAPSIALQAQDVGDERRCACNHIIIHVTLLKVIISGLIQQMPTCCQSILSHEHCFNLLVCSTGTTSRGGDFQFETSCQG